MPTISNATRRLRTRGETPPFRRHRGSAWSPDWFTARDGTQFDSAEARSIPAVGRAVSIIASQIASYPMHVFEESPTGEPRKVEPPAARVLWGLPNKTLGSQATFWRMCVAHKVLRENVFIFVTKDNGGRPIDLLPISPLRVKVGQLDDGRKVYEVDHELPMLDYVEGGEIIHVVGDTEDGLVGIGPLQRYASTFALNLTTEQYAAGTFEDGTPPGILHTDQVINQARAEELLESWMAKRALRPRRPAVLTNGLSWETTQFRPDESQMIESRHFGIAEVSRIFGVPPHLLGDVEKSTTFGTGLEEIALQFRTFTLNDHMLPIEQVLTTAFLPEGQWALFNPDAVLRPDTLKRYQAHDLALKGRWKNRNEVRRLEGLPPVVGGDDFDPPPNASIRAEGANAGA